MADKTGILLINLGTPEATSYWPVRAYLKEFLSDPRVIEGNRAIWWLVLNGIILTIRPKKSGHAYAQIWNRELNESPLKTFTRGQMKKLQEKFSDGSICIEWGMRYGHPAISASLDNLRKKGCDRILIFPLYPQYSATTTASVFDKVADAMKKLRWQPSLRFVPPFYNKPEYITALATRTSQHMKSLDWQPEKIIVSYHGLPEAYIEKGDPYYDQCIETTRLLREEMGETEDKMITTFQSRVGRMEWIKPYTDATIADLAAQGTKNIMLVSPAFISDCIETLEELSIGLAQEFAAAGGQNFSVAPCLNDSEVSIDMLEKITRDELKGW